MTTRQQSRVASLLPSPAPAEERTWEDADTRCLVYNGTERCQQDATVRRLCKDHYTEFNTSGMVNIERWLSDGRRRNGKPLKIYVRKPCANLGCTASGATVKGTEVLLCHRCRGQMDRRLKAGEAVDVQDWLDRFAEPPGLPSYAIPFGLIPHIAARLELIYVTQQFDLKREGRLYPHTIRKLVEDTRHHGFTTLQGQAEWILDSASGPVALTFRRFAVDQIEQAHRMFTGNDPTQGDLLYLQDLNLRQVKSSSKTTRLVEPLDLTLIRQEWLREGFRTWVLTTLETRTVIVNCFRTMRHASDALAKHRADQGHRPERLGLADMTTIVNYLHAEQTAEGETAPNYDTMKHILRNWWKVVDLSRRLGLWDEIPSSFARDSTLHRNQGSFSGGDDDDAGRALPPSVVTHLRNSTHLLGGKNAEMRRALIEVLIDTGRRPNEVVSLYRDCLEKDAHGGWILRWDNHKSRRMRRTLPLHDETADSIQRWLQVLDASGSKTKWLFPSPASIASARDNHVTGAVFDSILNELIKVSPPITTAVIGIDGTPVTVDLTNAQPYDFRHSYAQRHADSGMPPDWLMSLMDHKNIATTMGYYKVGAKRRREAAQMVAPLTRDKDGRLVGISEGRESLQTVAVPYGGCAEPANVQAGGQGCPVRFQCLSCPFYRPDPSYLPEMERHVADLKMNIAAARQMGFAAHVIANFQSQIDDASTVIKEMHEQLDAMPAEQRDRIEAMSGILRRARAADAQGLGIALTVANKDAETVMVPLGAVVNDDVEVVMARRPAAPPRNAARRKKEV